MNSVSTNKRNVEVFVKIGSILKICLHKHYRNLGKETQLYWSNLRPKVLAVASLKLHISLHVNGGAVVEHVGNHLITNQ